MTRRTAVSVAVVVLVEAWLYYQYAKLDAQFHFWLHALLGAGARLARTPTALRRRAACESGGRRGLGEGR